MTDKEKIDALIKDFDFSKVNITMSALDWGWCDVEGIPSIPVLKKLARSLLLQVALEREPATTETGGFCAKKYFTEDGEKHFRLAFVAEESDSEYLSEE